MFVLKWNNKIKSASKHKCIKKCLKTLEKERKEGKKKVRNGIQLS